jgi:hypothetical protein
MNKEGVLSLRESVVTIPGILTRIPKQLLHVVVYYHLT